MKHVFLQRDLRHSGPQRADLYHSVNRVSRTLNRQSGLTATAIKQFSNCVTDVEQEDVIKIERLLLQPGVKHGDFIRV